MEPNESFSERSITRKTEQNKNHLFHVLVRRFYFISSFDILFIQSGYHTAPLGFIFKRIRRKIKIFQVYYRHFLENKTKAECH